MAARAKVVSLVQQTLERPFECIAEISKYVVHNYNVGVTYSHIWTSYIANKAGLTDSQAPLTASCDRGANWFRKRKRYKLGQAYDGGYVPHSGDYVYISSTYEQADVTDVGIVLESDGTFVRFARWKEGCPKEEEWYNHNLLIVGYGVPDYEDAVKIDIPMLATKGGAVAIAGEEAYVHLSSSREAVRVGALKKGHAAEVLGTDASGWMKVVWGLSPTGYAYIDNAKFVHKIIRDELPYQKWEGFKIGDSVQFKGGKVFKQSSKSGKSKTIGPFVGKIDGVNNKDGMFHLECVKTKGWVCESDVDVAPSLGYNKHEGKVTRDNACLRIGPGKEFTKVQKWPQLAEGNVVDVLGTDVDNSGDEWYLITIEGVKGYIDSHCLSHNVEA